jgi:phospholipid transport system substrate-binding protein
MISCRVLIAGVAGALLVQVAAWAGAPTEQLRPALEELIQVLEDQALKPDSKTKEREARARAAVIDLVDFPEMARRTLGPHWRSLGESERDEFVRLFRALLEHTYLPKIALYRGERVRFVGESVDGDLAAVQAVVVTRDRKEVPVLYRLRQRDQRWLVYDIAVEGISLVNNYRSQFTQIMQRGSYQELAKRIRQRLDSTPSAGSWGSLGSSRGK